MGIPQDDTLPAERPLKRPLKRPATVGFFLLLALLVLGGALKQVTGNTIDPDLFWHLGNGQQLLRDGVRPLVDDRSFMSYRDPWVPYSWLADIALEKLWQFGGLRAAVVVGAAMIAAIVLLIALACCYARQTARHDVSDDTDAGLPPVLLATAVGMLLCLQYVAVRPVTMAFVVIAASMALLLRDRNLAERSRAVWLVPPLVAIGVNLHFFPGIVAVFLACFTAGAMWEMMRSRRDGDVAARRELVRRMRRYGILTALTALACAATPLILHMPRTLSYLARQDRMVSSGLIVEFWPFYRGPLGLACAALVCAIFALAIIYRRHVRAGEVFCTLITTLLILKHGRFLPLFAFAAAPLLAASIPPISSRALQLRALWAFASVAILISGYRLVTGLPNSRAPDAVWLNRLPDTKGYPCDAADYVLANVTPRSGRLINEFGWGGYLGWRLHGRFKVFVDGRTQIYPPSVWDATYLGSDEQLKQTIASANADAAIVSRMSDGARFEKALRELGWQIVYEDGRSRALLPPKGGK